MDITPFARLAVQKPQINDPYQIAGFQEMLKAKDPLKLLIDVLEESGAKVVLKVQDYFISKRLGGIPIRMKVRDRNEVRKSFALMRILPRKEFMVRAGVAIADRGALAISKKSMEMLQLANLGSKAIIVIREEDVLENMLQLPYSGHADYFQDAYLLTGKHSISSLFYPWLRNVPHLTVYVIAKNQKTMKKRRKFFAQFTSAQNQL